MIRLFDVNWKDPREVIALAQQVDPAMSKGLVVVRGDDHYSIAHASKTGDRPVVWPESNSALHV